MAQRYTPGYSRDRSPPPRQPDRYEAPRAPRGGNELFRGRGRGYAGRGDFRPDLRDRDLIRDARNSPPPFDNDRSLESRIGSSWRDEREFERRRSPPPSRGRGGPPASDFRDFRDAHPPRDEGIGRGRGGFGRGGGPPSRDEGFPVRGRGRGGFIPRGRGGFDDRARRRESMQDDRELFRARSRSPPPPPRADHWERPPPREQREPVRHDEWRPPPRRDSDRVMEHGELNDRYRNDRPPSAMGSRRTSAPSSRPSTPHGPGPMSNQPTSAPRQGQDIDRDQNLVRRVTSMTTPAPPRDLRREMQKPEYPASRIEASRGRYTSGASSPVRPPSVPAYGTSQFRQSSGATPIEGPQYNIFSVPGNSSRAGGPVSPAATRARMPPRSPSPALQPVQDPMSVPPTRPAKQASPPSTLKIPRARSPQKPQVQQPPPVNRPTPAPPQTSQQSIPVNRLPPPQTSQTPQQSMPVSRPPPPQTSQAPQQSAQANRPPPPEAAQAPQQVPQTTSRFQSEAPKQPPPREPLRDAPREAQREPMREAPRETPREAAREVPKEPMRQASRDFQREPLRETPRETPGEIPRAPTRDAPRDLSREPYREIRGMPREPFREAQRPTSREQIRDIPRETPRETPREPFRETQRPMPREQLRELSRETPRDIVRDPPRQVSQQQAREPVRDVIRDIPREAPLETAREAPRQFMRDPQRDTPRLGPRDAPRDVPREVSREVPREAPRMMQREMQREMQRPTQSAQVASSKPTEQQKVDTSRPKSPVPSRPTPAPAFNNAPFVNPARMSLIQSHSSEDIIMQDAPSRYNQPASRPIQAAPTPSQQAPPQGPSRFSQPAPRNPPIAPKAEVEKQAPRQPEADRPVPKGPKADRSQDTRSGFERRSQTFLVPPHNASRTDGQVSPMTRTSSMSGSASRPDMSQQPTQQLNMLKSPPLGPRQHPGFTAPAPPAAPRSENAPSAPQSMRVQTGTSGTSPQPSPNFVAPSGPRVAPPVAHPSPNLAARGMTSSQFPSPNTSNTSIPTGPRAGRGASQPPTRLQPPAPGPPGGWNQWSRPSMQGQQRGPVPIVPAKRDADGDEKSGDAHKNFIRADTVGAVELVRAPQSATSTSQGRAESVGDANAAFRRSLPRRESPKPPPKPKSPPRPLSPAFPDDAPLSPAFPGEDGDEDAMMLDEQDAEKNEAEFQKNKAELEAQKIDLTTRYLRGSTPLEKLAYLGRMAISEVVVEGEEVPVTTPELVMEEAPVEKQPTQLLTPKTEEVEDDGTMVDGNEPPTPPIGSPELKALPFLKTGPMTPLSDREIFHDNKRHQEAVRMLLQAELKRQDLDRIQTEEELSQKYAELYRPWRKYVDEMDRDKQEEGIGSDQAMGGMTAVASAALDPVATAAVVNENRRSRAAANATDYDMDRALQESLETAAIEAAKREKEALASRPDYDREAHLPDLLTEKEQTLRIFQDTSRKIDPSQALRLYALMPPRDDFTEAEHKIMVNRYKEYPKKFGTIAKSLPGRNFKECLNHYYTSKWSGEYKPPRDKRRRKGTARARPPAGGMRNKTNALISNLDETRDEPAVTESGRPRRAAAPTFGEKEVEEPTPAPAPAPKSRARIDPETGEKIKRPRAAPKEGRAARRPKAVSQASARQLSMSPEKRQLDLPAGASDTMADMRQKELEVANGLAAMQAGRTYSTMDYPQATQLDSGMTNDGYGAATGSVKPGSRRKDDSSSYWSVSEKNAFAENYSRLGNDWVGISSAMGTKSAQMVPTLGRYPGEVYTASANVPQVKNYFNRSSKDKVAETRDDNIHDQRTPAPSQRRRNEQPTPVFAPSVLPPSTESTISPPKRLLEQPVQPQHYPPPPSSMYPMTISRQVSRENLVKSPQRPVSATQAPPIESRLSYESLRGEARHEIRPSVSSFLQQPGQAPQYGNLTHQPMPRSEMDEFRARHELPPSQPPPQPWQPRDYRDEQRSYREGGPPIGLLQHAPSQQGQLGSTYQEPPRQQYSRFEPVHDQRRISVDHRLDDRRFLTDPRDTRMLMSPQLNTRPTYGQDPNLTRQPLANTPPALSATPQQASSLFRGDDRRYSMAPPSVTSPQPAQAAPVRHEPRKTSNLSAILNAEDPPERRPMPREAESLRTRTPVQGSYPSPAPPSRPQSQAGMRDEYGVPRSQQPGLPAYGAPPQRMEVEQREAPVYSIGRSEWQPTPRTTYTPIPPAGAQPTPYQPSETRLDSRPAFDHRASLSGITSRYNPSPPPSVFQNPRESTAMRHPYQPHPAPPAPLQYHQQVPHQGSPQVGYQAPYSQPPPSQAMSSTPTIPPHQRQTSGTFARPPEAEYHIRREREHVEQRYREEQQHREREQQEQRQQQERIAASRPDTGYFRTSSGQYPPPQQPTHQRSFSGVQYEPGHPGQQGSVPPLSQRPPPQQQPSQGQVPQHQQSLSDPRLQQQQQDVPRFGSADNRMPPSQQNTMPPNYGSRPGSTFGSSFGGYGQGPPPQQQQPPQGQGQGQGQTPPAQGQGDRRR